MCIVVYDGMCVSPIQDAVYYGHAPPTPAVHHQYNDQSFKAELFRHQVNDFGRQKSDGGDDDLISIDSPEIDTTNDWTPFYSSEIHKK